jgi:hypothetical protein
VPTAALAITPDPASTAADATLDASGSMSPNGDIVSYRFVFTDGSDAVESTAPRVTHRFTQPGQWMVAVIVTDVADVSARAEALASVIDGP